MLFLSYAEEDGNVAEEVATWFGQRGHEVVLSRTRTVRTSSDDHSGDPQADADADGLRPDRTEQQIGRADDYLALFSPDFLASALCRRERELATRREQDLQTKDPDAKFLHVLQVRETQDSADGFPHKRQWVKLAGRQDRDGAFLDLAKRLWPPERPRNAHPAVSGLVAFRNRSDELEQCLRALTTTGGPHFWLVIAPPQLGKTWFLDQVGSALHHAQTEPAWVVRLVDLRDQPAQARTDPGALLRSLSGGDGPTTTDVRALQAIALAIIKSGKRHLWLIDSAELLAVDTAGRLRSCLSQIHDIVVQGGTASRLAVVVASRREVEWLGLTEGPRPSVLRLTEFSQEIMQQALSDLARAMGRSFGADFFKLNGARAHRLSEGLPALLVGCLTRVYANEWTLMEDLETQEVFQELAEPYIQKCLLSPESLFPLTHGHVQPQLPGPTDAPLLALEHAIRNLAPYRLFTQSHLRHHLRSDPDLAASTKSPGWEALDLWRAISDTALLTRPLDEPWQEIPAAIRRLFFRFHYASDEARAEAHRAARSFIARWAEQQKGKEQIVGLVECLWHEAAIPRPERGSTFEADICESARDLSLGLEESGAYTADELRGYAKQRIEGDLEFQKAVGDPGLVARLISIIVAPGSG